MEEIVVLEAPPRLVEAVAVDLPFPKHAQTLLQLLNRLYPVATRGDAALDALTPDISAGVGVAERSDASLPLSIEHLKRIRKSATSRVLEVLVERLDAQDRADELRRGSGEETGYAHASLPPSLAASCPLPLRERYAAMLDAVGRQCGGDVASALSLHTVDVPDRAPRHRPQDWLEWNAVWPLAVPKPHAPEKPSTAFAEAANAVMRGAVLPLAERVVREEPHLLGIAAVVVDSSDTDGGQARVLVTSEGCTSMDRRNPNACCAYVEATMTDESATPSMHRAIVMEHPVMFALKKLAAFQVEDEASKDGSGGDTEDGDGKEAARQRAIAARKPYLANDLDLYVSHEPCVMCAMALVHSRIARVFFCFPNLVHGGVGSVYAVHAIPSLNHHFRAYHCTEAAKEYSGARLL